MEEGKLDKEVVVAKYAPTTQHNAIKGKQQMYFTFRKMSVKKVKVNSNINVFFTTFHSICIMFYNFVKTIIK